jgi:hypothetical protein
MEAVMSRSRLVRSASVFVVAIGALLSAFPQTQQSPSTSSDEFKTEAEKLYAGAHPYMDEPLAELKKMAHELAGLKPGSNPDQPSDLLAKIGTKADELLRKVPDLISEEAVSQAQWPTSSGCLSEWCGIPINRSQRDQTFNYLILTHPVQDGGVELQEYRTNRNGKPVTQGIGTPNFQGFTSAWVIFSSSNQVESRFRYLGQQQTDGRSAYVIGFAQIPGLTESPARIQVDRESIPMLLQGIAWVDQSDFRILRLRTDLLAPQPEIQVQKQTANILFGKVNIAHLESALWLPQSVNLEMEARGQTLHEEHKYSKYRLYKAKSRIILSPMVIAQITSPRPPIGVNNPDPKAQEPPSVAEVDRMDSAIRANKSFALVENPAKDDEVKVGVHPIDGSLRDLVPSIPHWAPADIDERVPPVTSDAPCPLAQILQQSSNRTQDLIKSLHRFTANERIELTDTDKNGKRRLLKAEEVTYVVQIAQNSSGYPSVEEYRSGTSGRPPAAVIDTGIAASALIFHPTLIGNFDFRCEGLTQLRDSPAWQLHFEERAAPNESFSEIKVRHSVYSLRLKGRAWIAKDNDEVLRIETDLQSPIPQINLQVEHTVIDYAPVEFPKRQVRLWLPEDTAVYLVYRGHHYETTHQFSQFQLFSVDSSESIKAVKDGSLH